MNTAQINRTNISTGFPASGFCLPVMCAANDSVYLIEVNNQIAFEYGQKLFPQFFGIHSVPGDNELGNLKKETRVLSSETIDYAYDPASRLLSANYSNAAFNDMVYTYDKVGNRLTAQIGSTTYYYVYNNSGNRLDKICTAQPVANNCPSGQQLYRYAYNDNGSLTAKYNNADTQIASYTWNQKKQLTTDTTNSATSSYVFDPFGYRIQKTHPDASVNKYYLSGAHLESVYDGSNQLQASYQRGQQIDEIVSANIRVNTRMVNQVFYQGMTGSVDAVTDANGAVQQATRYAPFGETISQSGSTQNAFLYTGRELDSGNGLYHYRARQYDAFAGRFISEDPIGFGGGINFYSYVDNNPLIYFDPMGNDAFFYHAIQGYQAGRILGYGFFESVRFGYNVGMQDFRTPSASDASSTIQNLHGTGGMINGHSQTADERSMGITAALNDPRTGLMVAFDRSPANDEILWSIAHNAADIANDGHRNGAYEGLTWNPVSWLETAYHLVVTDTILPLFDWGQRVDNIVTAVEAHKNGDVLDFDQSTGEVGVVRYPSDSNNSAMINAYGK